MTQTRIGRGTLLNDVDIVRRMVHDKENKRIVVTPIISMRQQLGPNSLDLRLGTEFVLKERSEHVAIDPVEALAGASDPERRYRRIKRVSPLDPFTLHTAEFVVAQTLEYVRLPRDVMGLLQGRSTWSRHGLVVHLTAGFIHAGSESPIVFELRNIGDVPIKLYPGTRIAQIAFLEMSSEAFRSYKEKKESKYAGAIQGSVGPYWLDSEFAVIRKGLKEDSRKPLMAPVS